MNNIELLQEFYETGDAKLLGFFFQSQIDFIYRIAFSITKNATDAEDIVQQVYFIILEKRSKCHALKEKDEKKIQAWIAIICTNESKLFLRRKKINKTVIQNKQKELRNKSMENTKDGILDILECINQLPQKTRLAIHLHYREDLPINEVAVVMRIKPSSVRSLLAIGLDKIRKALIISGITLSSSTILNQIQAYPLEKAPQNLIDKCQSLNRAPPRLKSINLPSKGFILSTILLAVLLIYYFQMQKEECVEHKKEPKDQIVNDLEIGNNLLHKKWVFDGNNKYPELVDINHNTQYDESQKAIRLKDLKRPCLFDINAKYNRPIKLSLHGHLQLKNNDINDFSFNVLVWLQSENSELLPFKVIHEVQDNFLEISLNKKVLLNRDVYLLGNYIFVPQGKENTYAVARSVSDSRVLNSKMLLLLQCQYIDKVEIKEMNSNEKIDALNYLKNCLIDSMDFQKYKDVFNEIQLSFEKMP